MEARPGEEAAMSVEDRLAKVVLVMHNVGMEAVLIDGYLEGGEFYEGLSLESGGLELGSVRFSKGELVDKQADSERIKEERGLMMAGLTLFVLEEVVAVAQDVYSQGGDLIDERFDVIPGFNR